MDILYHTIITLGLLIVSPVFLIRALIQPRFRRELIERLFGWRHIAVGPDPIWIHAASVGEVKLALTLIAHLKQTIPEHPLVLSTFTATGLEVARQANACPSFLMPPDSAVFIHPLLDRLQPANLLLIEAELWPGLLRICHKRGVPILLLNGRMSEGSLNHYKKMHPIFPWMAEGLHYFAMRTEADVRRVKKLGMSDCRVGLTGNMKYDAVALPSTNGNESGTVIVFGSTRPGDEEPIIEAIDQLKTEFPQVRYVIAPRHMDRIGEVAGLLKGKELPFVRHTRMKEERNFSPFITLVDQLGVLNDYYQHSQAAFVGGGFRPEHGGQNILEPAMCSLPVLFGTNMQNFEEEALLLKNSGGGIELEGPEHLLPMLKFLLENPEERAQLGQQAAGAVLSQRGAVERNTEIIRESLKFSPNAK